MLIRKRISVIIFLITAIISSAQSAEKNPYGIVSPLISEEDNDALLVFKEHMDESEFDEARSALSSLLQRAGKDVPALYSLMASTFFLEARRTDLIAVGQPADDHTKWKPAYHSSGGYKIYAQSIDWLYKAASGGSALAMMQLAAVYQLGLGTGWSEGIAFEDRERNLVESWHWYVQAAEAGSGQAILVVADKYRYGWNSIVDADLNQEAYWRGIHYTDHASKDEAMSHALRFADIFAEAAATEWSVRTTMFWRTTELEMRLEVLQRLPVNFLTAGMRETFREDLKELQLDSGRLLTDRQRSEITFIGEICKEYAICPFDPSVDIGPQIARTLIQNAQAGDSQAMFEVSRLFQNGFFVEQDDGEAYAWAVKSADEGNWKGTEQLAKFLTFGIGTPINKPKARARLEIASRDKTNVSANLMLATVYWKGIGGEVRDNEAVLIVRGQLASGDARVYQALAQMYYQGVGGLPRDFKKVIGLMRLGGVSSQSEDVRRYASDLSEAEVAEIIETADTCVETQFANCPY